MMDSYSDSVILFTSAQFLMKWSNSSSLKFRSTFFKIDEICSSVKLQACPELMNLRKLTQMNLRMTLQTCSQKYLALRL